MSRDWKPGDVARLAHGAVGLRVRYSPGLCPEFHERTDHWHECEQWISDDSVGNQLARPLVVLDPEDRKQVARLLELESQQYGRGWGDPRPGEIDKMQAALRGLLVEKTTGVDDYDPEFAERIIRALRAYARSAGVNVSDMFR